MRIQQGNLCSWHSRRIGRPARWIVLFWHCVCVAEPGDIAVASEACGCGTGDPEDHLACREECYGGQCTWKVGHGG